MYILLTFSVVFFAISLFLLVNKNNSEIQVTSYNETEETEYDSKQFLKWLFVVSMLVRSVLLLIINATDAITKLGLSSDSLYYARVGKIVAVQMANGDFNWPNWIDNGWFQFNGLVFYLFGPYPFYVQLFNITVASIMPIIVFQTVRKVFPDIRIAKLTALMTAFFPSFIYWSVLMLKDPISWLAVAFLVYGTVSIKIKFSVKYMLSILLGLIIFLGVREYMLYISMMIIVLALVPLKGAGFGVVLRWVAVIIIMGFVAQLAGFGFFAIDRISESVYFDIDYLNHARVKLSNHGSGRFFQNEEDAVWGQGFMHDLKAFSLAVYYSFLSLDITSLGSVRQLMALPEVLLFMNLLPNLVVGAKQVWKTHRNLALPLLGFGVGILVVYGSTTTNKGALFRWRMQALPYLLAIISYGIYYRKKGWFYRLLIKYKI
jgi:hypothetical protein